MGLSPSGYTIVLIISGMIYYNKEGAKDYRWKLRRMCVLNIIIWCSSCFIYSMGTEILLVV